MKHGTRILCATALLGLAGAAQADVYAGLGVYSSSIEAAQANALGAIDGDDVTPSLFVGWRPIELIGVELGYYDLGSADQAGNSLDAHALTLAGLLSLELGPVAGYIKAGMANSSFDVTVPAGVSSTTFDDTSADPFGGIGISFDVMDKLYIYAEHMIFTGDASSSAFPGMPPINIDMSATGIGLRYTL